MGKYLAHVLRLEPANPSMEFGISHRTGNCECNWDRFHRIACMDVFFRIRVGYWLRSIRPGP